MAPGLSSLHLSCHIQDKNAEVATCETRAGIGLLNTGLYAGSRWKDVEGKTRYLVGTLGLPKL